MDTNKSSSKSFWGCSIMTSYEKQSLPKRQRLIIKHRFVQLQSTKEKTKFFPAFQQILFELKSLDVNKASNENYESFGSHILNNN